MSNNISYYSQANQDKWICEIFNQKRNGVFIDIGAMDGILYSNTYTLEKYFDWKGICIEPDSISFESLSKNRTSENIKAAISNFDGESFIDTTGGPCTKISESGIKIEVYTFNSILEKINFDSQIEIDYLSIDVEGEEENLLSSIDFEKFFIKAITIEHNLYCSDSSQKDAIYKILSSNGFIRVVEDVVCLDKSPHVFNQPYEDWYINSKCDYLLSHPKSKIQPHD